MAEILETQPGKIIDASLTLYLPTIDDAANAPRGKQSCFI
jgi:hypothetical protein